MKVNAYLAGLFLCCTGLVHAEEFAATLVRVSDGKVTFTRGMGRKKKEYTLPVEAKCRAFLAKYDAATKKIGAGDELAGGLKNPLFGKLDQTAIGAWVCTDADTGRIVELRLYQMEKKKR